MEDAEDAKNLLRLPQRIGTDLEDANAALSPKLRLVLLQEILELACTKNVRKLRAPVVMRIENHADTQCSSLLREKSEERRIGVSHRKFVG